MVNTKHRLLASGACSIRQSNDRKIITNGPVYDLSEAQSLLRQHGLRVVNERAVLNQVEAFDPEMSDEELTTFILNLVSEDRAESERCQTGIGLQIDCDAYVMKWNRNKRVRWEHGPKLYVKFGFSEKGNNSRCLVVSLHPAKW